MSQPQYKREILKVDTSIISCLAVLKLENLRREQNGCGHCDLVGAVLRAADVRRRRQDRYFSWTRRY